MTSNKLWLVQPRPEPAYKELGYDCNYGFVIEAKTSQEARELASEYPGDEGPDFYTNPEKSVCSELKPDGRSGVIMADFHAG